MKQYSTLIVALCVTLVSASHGLGSARIVSPLTEPDHPLLPNDATRYDCFMHIFEPAKVLTNTTRIQTGHQRLAFHPVTGQAEIHRPATFDVKTKRKVLKEERELWYPTVCPQIYTERFVKSLQRALRARGYYAPRPSGELDDTTLDAIRLFQSERGLDAEHLSLDAAEEFGLTSHRDFRKFLQK